MKYYYLKSEVDERLAEKVSQDEVNDMMRNISTLNLAIVESLPTEDISTTTIYLVAKTGGEERNIYDEYIYVAEKWEKIGDTETKIDLTGYIKNTDYASDYNRPRNCCCT